MTRPFERIQPGEMPRAEDWNRLVSIVEHLLNMQVAGPVDFSASESSGFFLHVREKEDTFVVGTLDENLGAAGGIATTVQTADMSPYSGRLNDAVDTGKTIEIENRFTGASASSGDIVMAAWIPFTRSYHWIILDC